MGLRNWTTLVLQGIGIALLWLPLHYSFYRYSIIGEGVSFALALCLLTAGCLTGVVLRRRLESWLSQTPAIIMVIALLTLASNGFLTGLPYLPIDAATAVVIRLLAVAFYIVVFLCLFFAWVQRLSETMFRIDITTAVSVFGLIIVTVFFLVDLFYTTFIYRLFAIACLAVSGLCWFASRSDNQDDLEEEKKLRFLPTAHSLRDWSLLFVAFIVTELLHALTFSEHGATSEQSLFPSWLLHLGLVLFAALFAGLFLLRRNGRSNENRTFLNLITLVVAFYIGTLALMGTPEATGADGNLAILTVVLRTMRIFIFLLLMILCYRDSVMPSSAFGLLFLLLVVLSNALCYIIVPALFAWVRIDPGDVMEPSFTVLALLLIVLLAGFLFMAMAGIHRQSTAPLAGYAANPDNPDAPSQRLLKCQSIACDNNLTQRECDIMYYLSVGYSLKKIAETLYVSNNTAATHRGHIYAKLGVHSRQEIIDLVEANLL